MNCKKILFITSEYAEINSYLAEVGYEVAVNATLPDKEQYSLVLIDYELLTQEFISTASALDIPVMCIADEDISDSEIKALYSLGCADYITVPICRAVLLARVNNQIELKAGKCKMNIEKDYLQNTVLSASNEIKNQLTAAERLSQLLATLDGIGDDARVILSYLNCNLSGAVGILESRENKAVNESRHRGGFVRKTTPSTATI